MSVYNSSSPKGITVYDSSNIHIKQAYVAGHGNEFFHNTCFVSTNGIFEVGHAAVTTVENVNFHLMGGDLDVKGLVTARPGTIGIHQLIVAGSAFVDTNNGKISWKAPVSAYCIGNQQEIPSTYLPAAENCGMQIDCEE